MKPHNNALSNYDIEKIMRSQGIDDFQGVYMKNDLPEKLERGSYIVNLQSSQDGQGTHWTAFYKTSKFSYYFDSFGFVPPLEVQNKIKPYIYSDIDIQDLASSSCGFYCIAFILYMCKKLDKERAFQSFVNLFKKDTERNENILYRILYD